ncbi:ComEC/Rec2 family competence protein [Limibaculum sp. M0105]|uniref:ComEC/Rec2 family competence protein n=1 Tax=Thermohalobaculum xanthum TaxID=2753746 RepID=A0A8J7M6W6_9RHOB|nr:ComEC/Rec2 family competence protein [Thermohalobaculum xanthum]MBK0398820.1 ComEC/Rec2 family competence protein [Thermohalobaculum xanthum]
MGAASPGLAGAVMGQARRVGKVGLWHRIDWGGALALEMRRAGLWLPVLLGMGIWLYFALPAEPPAWTAVLAAVPLLAATLSRVRGHLVLRGVVFAALALSMGYALALVNAHRVAAPVLDGPRGLTVEGRVLVLDRSASEAPRVLLDRVTLFGVEEEETPARLRVALLGLDFTNAPRPGEVIRLSATLLPPGDPVEPGGFDFGTRAFFEGIGAVGYSRNPVLRIPSHEAMATDAGGPVDRLFDRLRLWLASTRMDLAEAIRAAVSGASGAFAAAIIVGDRAGIAEVDAEALRISSLAHLLAISGLHMGLLTGLVFAAVRFGLALPARIALRWPTKKVAAVAALLAGAGYLMLSGATVATQRAFVMVGVAFLAVLFDRPAISLRGLALAAAVVLAVRPVSLFDVGFQMSFAATLALVAGYEQLAILSRSRREKAPDAPPLGLRGRILRVALVWTGGLVITSLVAGAATAPFSTYHFNRLAPYGLLANLGAVPVMGLVIAPSAILAALGAPLGLAGLPLGVMGAGIDWVLGVAHATAALPGADRVVPAGASEHLALIALGGLWLALWRGGWRLVGVAPILAGLALWIWLPPQRPVLIVAPNAALVGLMGPEGRALDRAKGQSYAAETWLRRDGDGADQPLAAARPGLEHGRSLRGALGGGWRLEVVNATRPEPGELAALCTPKTLLIARNAAEAPAGACLFYGRAALRRAGAIAVWPGGGGVEGRAQHRSRAPPLEPPQAAERRQRSARAGGPRLRCRGWSGFLTCRAPSGERPAPAS